MSPIKCLASISLAAITLPALHSQPRCPGNIASLPFQLVQRARIIVPVAINHTGPYPFLLDTGTRFTIVDPLLAAELHLKTEGLAEVVGPGFSAYASFADLDLLEAGSHSVADYSVAVHDLQPLQAADLHFRGIIGGDFLGHFDVLLDYAHSMLCLDDTKAMQAAVKGGHIALATPSEAANELPLTTLLIIPVHLSGFGSRQLLLTLDSAANAPFLFNHAAHLSLGLPRASQARGFGADGVKRVFSVLPPQSMQIGSINMQQVSFAVPAESGENDLTSEQDGLLTTVLFRRVFISYTDRFVVLDPW
jgi:hypothetical protein